MSQKDFQVGWYTLKLHIFDHYVEDLERFGSPDMLHEPPFEKCKGLIKQACRSESQ